jgi:SAM-dependent methyltransferase
MSIFPQMASFILKEHRRRPIEGNVVLIGRQTVNLSISELVALLEREAVGLRSDYSTETDNSTIGSYGQRYISDRAFFSLFSSAKVMALDVSAYEGAEIVHDLNQPLPDKLSGIADFIFNGSCLDNLFDPATAIKSMSKMLKPAGRIIHLEHGTAIQDAFLCYSPEWFFDFYAINNYDDCQNYICTFKNSLQNTWEVYSWKPFYELGETLMRSGCSLQIGDFINIVVAEKGLQSTDSRTPIQGHYREWQDAQDADEYVRKYREFHAKQLEYQFDSVEPTPLTPPPPPPSGIKGYILNTASFLGISIAKGGPVGYRFEKSKSKSPKESARPGLVRLGFLTR